jgi:hypothetical protein
MPTLRLAAALLVLALAATAHAKQPPRLTLTLGAWAVGLDGETSRIEDADGSPLDLGDTLDPDRAFSPEARLRWQFAERHALTITYNGLRLDEDRLLGQSVRVDGTTVPGLAYIDAKSEMHFLRVDWRRALFAPDSAAGNLETVLGVLGFTVDAEYAAHPPGLGWLGALPEETRRGLRGALFAELPDGLQFLNTALYYDYEYEVTGALPVVGLAGHVNLGSHLALRGQALGMYAGEYGHFLDLEAELAYRPVDAMELYGGYRLWRVKVGYNDETYTILGTGVTAGGALRF